MRDSAVEAYFDDATNWSDELCELRRILLDMGLDEALKWRQPCYSDAGKNVVILGVRKACCALSFFKGALLTDPDGLLIVPGPNTQSGRYMALTSVEQVRALTPAIRAFTHEAIAHTRAGRRVKREPATPDDWPDELVHAFADDPEMATAFNALTPGRQRGFLLLFKGAKQSMTRTRRILGARERILRGKGRHDCICGRSKTMPRCDGSHQYL